MARSPGRVSGVRAGLVPAGGAKERSSQAGVLPQPTVAAAAGGKWREEKINSAVIQTDGVPFTFTPSIVNVGGQKVQRNPMLFTI